MVSETKKNQMFKWSLLEWTKKTITYSMLMWCLFVSSFFIHFMPWNISWIMCLNWFALPVTVSDISRTEREQHLFHELYFNRLQLNIIISGPFVKFNILHCLLKYILHWTITTNYVWIIRWAIQAQVNSGY